MLDLVAFIVAKNDAYYADMLLQSILPYCKGVYCQDQMSTDGTYEKVCEIAKEWPGKLIVERVDTGHRDRFEQGYDEPKWRTVAVKRCEELFNPEWIIKADLDEIYSEYFFHSLEAILPNANFESVRVSGDRFVSPTKRAIMGVTNLEKTEFSPSGGAFVDPHTQVWRSGKYYYRSNPNLPGTFLHPVLTPEPRPEYWLPGICNVHLHRTFGPKAFKFWAEGGDLFEEKAPFHPPTMAPKWYNAPVNTVVEEVDFKWPDFVMTKWQEWGIW